MNCSLSLIKSGVFVLLSVSGAATPLQPTKGQMQSAHGTQSGVWFWG